MDFIVFVIFILVLWGIGWLVINFWPILIILAFVGVGVFIAHVYEPPPDPRREIQDAKNKAMQDIDKAGKAYRKQVKDLTK